MRTHRNHAHRNKNGSVQLYVRGDIDLQATPRLHSEIVHAVASRAEDVVLDCSDMTSIDATGIRLLVELSDILRGQRRELRVVRLREGPARAIGALGLAPALRVEACVPTEEVPVVG